MVRLWRKVVRGELDTPIAVLLALLISLPLLLPFAVSLNGWTAREKAFAVHLKFWEYVHQRQRSW